MNIASSQDNESGLVPTDSDGVAEQVHADDLVTEVQRENENLTTNSPTLEATERVKEVGTALGGLAPCTFCDTQDLFDPDLQFAGISCDQWAFFSMFAPPGDECTLLRAAAVKFCGCPTQVEETCQLCPNGYDGYQEDQSILFVKEVLCRDLVGFVAVDGERTCDFVERFSYACSCPGIVPSCSLCGQNSDGEHLQMTRPNEVLVEGDNSPLETDTTCSDWDKMLNIDPKSTPLGAVAEGLDGMTLCEESLRMSEEQTGLQLAGLCGCPGVEPANQCSPCSEGFELDASKEECDRLTFITSFVTNQTRCAFLQERAIVVGCCVLSEYDFETVGPTLSPDNQLPTPNDVPTNDNLPPSSDKPPQTTEETTNSAATSIRTFFGILCTVNLIVLAT